MTDGRRSGLRLRDPDSQYSAGWIELLFDLAFVVALGSTTHTLVGVEMPEGLTQFLVTFLLITWSWTAFTFFVNVFEGAENWHFVALSQIAIVLVLATFHELYGEDYFEFVVGYTVLRLIAVGMFLRAWLKVPEVRQFTSMQAVGIVIALVPMWLGLGTDDRAQRELALLATALLQIMVPLVAFFRDARVSMNSSHTTERAGLFMTLALGECFLSVARVGEHVGEVTFNMIVNGMAAVLMVFALWRLYFGMLAQITFSGRHNRSVFWTIMHLPLVASVLGMAAGLERNLFFLREDGARASDRLLTSWGVALFTIVLLSLFWRSKTIVLRTLIWQVLSVVTAVAVIWLPHSAYLVTPTTALYGLCVMSLVLMTINPAIRPWGYGALPEPYNFERRR